MEIQESNHSGSKFLGYRIDKDTAVTEVEEDITQMSGYEGWKECCGGIGSAV